MQHEVVCEFASETLQRGNEPLYRLHMFETNIPITAPASAFAYSVSKEARMMEGLLLPYA